MEIKYKKQNQNFWQEDLGFLFLVSFFQRFQRFNWKFEKKKKEVVRIRDMQIWSTLKTQEEQWKVAVDQKREGNPLGVIISCTKWRHKIFAEIFILSS